MATAARTPAKAPRYAVRRAFSAQDNPCGWDVLALSRTPWGAVNTVWCDRVPSRGEARALARMLQSAQETS
jgi:hypothetical protein